MSRPAPGYSELESKILIFLYGHPETPDSTSIWLAQNFFPESKLATPEFGQPLQEVVEATEELILKGLVDGELQKTRKQLFFSGTGENVALSQVWAECKVRRRERTLFYITNEEMCSDNHCPKCGVLMVKADD
jgi:hypothetical protein